MTVPPVLLAPLPVAAPGVPAATGDATAFSGVLADLLPSDAGPGVTSTHPARAGLPGDDGRPADTPDADAVDRDAADTLAGAVAVLPGVPPLPALSAAATSLPDLSARRDALTSPGTDNSVAASAGTVTAAPPLPDVSARRDVLTSPGADNSVVAGTGTAAGTAATSLTDLSAPTSLPDLSARRDVLTSRRADNSTVGTTAAPPPSDPSPATSLLDVSARRGVLTPRRADNSAVGAVAAPPLSDVSAPRDVPTLDRADNSGVGRTADDSGPRATQFAATSTPPPVTVPVMTTVPAGTPAMTHTATASAAAHAERAQPELTSAIVRLGRGVEGVRSMEVQLHPAELGAVHVRVAIHQGRLDVTVACADPAARDAVTAALPTLHRDLAHLGSVDVVPTRQNDTAGDQPGGRPGDHPDEQSGRQPHRDPRPDVEDFLTHLTGSTR